MQISSILSSLLPQLPPMAEPIEIVSASIVPLSVPTTSSMSLEEDIEIDTFVGELLQYAIKDFFLFPRILHKCNLEKKILYFIANLLTIIVSA